VGAGAPVGFISGLEFSEGASPTRRVALVEYGLMLAG
jgi:hypothetical protein